MRFPGFEGEWEEQCLETFMYSRDERQIPSPDAPLMAFIAKLGVAPKGERYDREYLVKSKDKEYKRTEFNDFIYSFRKEYDIISPVKKRYSEFLYNTL